ALDQRAAALARQPGSTVDAKTLLHSATRVGPVAEVGPLVADPGPERLPHAVAQCRDLLGGERARLAPRVDLRPPERLVGVDVPEPRDRPLVEDRRLHRRLAAAEPLGEKPRREAALERLGTNAHREVVLCLFRLEQRPGAEAPQVAIGDPRA